MILIKEICLLFGQFIKNFKGKKMIDIGANLTNPCFDDDLDEVLERAKINNISKIIITGTDCISSLKAIELSKNYPNYLLSTAGVHPHEADNYSDEVNSKIDRIIKQNKEHNLVAVGETGLDFYRNFSKKENQYYAFESQINLAIENKLPLFLHERDAYNDFHSILSKYTNKITNAVVHCFTGNLIALKSYLELGLYIGITGWICDKKRGSELREIVKYIPKDRLLIETDAPYLTPQCNGVKKHIAINRRNEPSTLPLVANKLSECCGINVDELIYNCTENTNRFFNL